jgi:hypothetical protein
MIPSIQMQIVARPRTNRSALIWQDLTIRFHEFTCQNLPSVLDIPKLQGFIQLLAQQCHYAMMLENGRTTFTSNKMKLCGGRNLDKYDIS